ncbi:MAG TPA: Type 1 glutamine amidotransferase-like domain-containing protein [Symbiobacteriaceae bacterium]|jgi:cyanophycinase
MKLERLGDITSELSSNLVKSIFLPGGLLEWLSKPLAGLRERSKAGAKPGEAVEAVTARPAVALGPTVLLGGIPVPDEAIVAILHLAGGRTARVAVVPVAAMEQDRAAAAEEVVRLFTRFGMRKVEVLELSTREQADNPELVTKLAASDAVVLCGASAATGLQVLRDTACARVLKELQAAGKPVAGLNGGAKILADRLITLQNGVLTVAEGIGLVPGLLIETDFTQEARFGRVVKALNESAAGLMGMGLDAGSAAVIRDGESKVLGDTTVTFLDPRESTPGNDPGSCCGLKVHVLMDGFIMNLRSRKPSGPPKEPAQAAGDR